MVVSIAEVADGRIVSRPHPRLPGVAREGRYVFYRSSSPLGFVAGTAASPAGPVRAVVEVPASPPAQALPFVYVAGADGAYVLPALPGSAVTVAARVPATSFRGSGTTAVAAGETATLDLLLSGVVTTATVVPADGAQGVPRSALIGIESAAPLKPVSIGADTVKLYKGAVSDGVTVPLRFVLTGGGRTLSVAPVAPPPPAPPQTPLHYSTYYTLVVSGLADVYDESGVGAPGHLPHGGRSLPPRMWMPSPSPARHRQERPGDGAGRPALAQSTILVVNAGNGVVASFTVLGDGSVSGRCRPPSTTVVVTVTDP
jgi:hypothetical protein